MIINTKTLSRGENLDLRIVKKKAQGAKAYATDKCMWPPWITIKYEFSE
jgi:hypothetical protein